MNYRLTYNVDGYKSENITIHIFKSLPDPNGN